MIKKIALEEHFISPEFIPSTEKVLKACTPQQRQELFKLLGDLENERIQTMDKNGIEIAVLSLTDPGVQHEKEREKAIKLARQANDFLAKKIEKNPTRLRGFAHLPLQDPKAAAEELDRCVKELKFVGALINGQTNGHYLDEAQYHIFWERVQALDVPVYLHPGDAYQLPYSLKDHPELNGALWGWAFETGSHALRLVFSGLFDKFPGLKLILGHMGESLPYFLWRFDSRYQIFKPSQPLKKLPSEYIRENMAVTISGMFAKEPLLCALSALGEENVMFSVDYPYESTEVATQFIENVSLNESIRHQVCYQNAAKLLKLNR